MLVADESAAVLIVSVAMLIVSVAGTVGRCLCAWGYSQTAKAGDVAHITRRRATGIGLGAEIWEVDS